MYAVDGKMGLKEGSNFVAGVTKNIKFNSMMGE
jgi:hypothetical protein